MSWATRATAIASVFWAIFVLLLMSSTRQTPTPEFLLFWLAFFAMPCGVLWLVLSLIFGNRGSVNRY